MEVLLTKPPGEHKVERGEETGEYSINVFQTKPHRDFIGSNVVEHRFKIWIGEDPTTQ